MPNTKNFYLRVRILDGLLQSRKGVSIQECLRVINNRLAARDIPPVTSKDTILKDMTEIANEKHIIIESFLILSIGVSSAIDMNRLAFQSFPHPLQMMTSRK